MESKNLYLLKCFIEDKEYSDEEVCVIAALRNIIMNNVTDYFISYNMIAHYMFGRSPTRYELDSIKDGVSRLINKRIINVVSTYSKTECYCDLSRLYFRKEKNKYYVDIMSDELLRIMNIKTNMDKYKIFRYYCSVLGCFNHSIKIEPTYRGKLGTTSLDSFADITNISKKTISQYNKILEDNELLYIVRHKDFGVNNDNKELPNTYCRYFDKKIALEFLSKVNNISYICSNKKTKVANTKRGLAQKYIAFCKGKNYDLDTLNELYKYCLEWNNEQENIYKREKEKGYSPALPRYKDVEKIKKLL